jgi:hypothetical protein
MGIKNESVEVRCDNCNEVIQRFKTGVKVVDTDGNDEIRCFPCFARLIDLEKGSTV